MTQARRRPAISELRSVAQPPSTVGRASGEHWAGRLYMRHISVYLTRLLVPTRVSPDAVTWVMLLVGIVAAVVLTQAPWWTALVTLLLIQLQGLLDCVDGELARWRRQTGAAGIYLDRLAHWVTDSGLVIAIGVRADGGFGSLAGWTTLGLAAGWLVVIGKGETELVHVSRALSGLPAVVDSKGVAEPSVGWLRRLRRTAGRLPFNRLLLAMELSAGALVTAAIDAATDSRTATQVFSVVLLVIAVIVAVGHLAAILTSARLR